MSSKIKLMLESLQSVRVRSIDALLIDSGKVLAFEAKYRFELQDYYANLRSLDTHADIAAFNVFISYSDATLQKALRIVSWIPKPLDAVESFIFPSFRAPSVLDNFSLSFPCLEYWPSLGETRIPFNPIAFYPLNQCESERLDTAGRSALRPQRPIGFWAKPNKPEPVRDLLQRKAPFDLVSGLLRDSIEVNGCHRKRPETLAPLDRPHGVSDYDVMDVVTRALRFMARALEPLFQRQRLQPLLFQFVVTKHDWFKIHGPRPPRVLVKRLVSCFQQGRGCVHGPLAA